VDGVAIRRIVILPDSIDREDFRQLRVSLRWKWSSLTTGASRSFRVCAYQQSQQVD